MPPNGPGARLVDAGRFAEQGEACTLRGNIGGGGLRPYTGIWFQPLPPVFEGADPDQWGYPGLPGARRPWGRVTIYDEEGRIVRRVKPRSWVDEAGEGN